MTATVVTWAMWVAMTVAIAMTVPFICTTVVMAELAVVVVSAMRAVPFVATMVVVRTLLFVAALGLNILLLWMRFLFEAAIVVDCFANNREGHEARDRRGKGINSVLGAMLNLWGAAVFTGLGHGGRDACDRKSGGDDR
jgi:hypothetical protein